MDRRETHETDSLGEQFHDFERQLPHFTLERLGAFPEPGAVLLGRPAPFGFVVEAEADLVRLFRVRVPGRGSDLRLVFEAHVLGGPAASSNEEETGQLRSGSSRKTTSCPAKPLTASSA